MAPKGSVPKPKPRPRETRTDGATQPARSFYIRKALSDPTLVGQVREMKELYTKQVGKAKDEDPPSVPSPLHSHATFVGTLRILQWNLNCLCGIDGQTPQRAASVLKLLAPCEADVLVFQEMPRGPAQSWWWEPWRSTFPAEEMRTLEKALQELGYQTQLRSSCFSSTLVCTKLTVVAVSEVSLDVEHAFRHRMAEDRAALLVSLQLPGDEVVSICATHLHHQNLTGGSDGVRKAEMELILPHCAANTPSESRCTLMVADFNQARRCDYSAAEWSVISAGLRSIGEPEDDGVAGLLASQGWVCTYDVAAERSWRGPHFVPPLTHWTGTTVDYAYMKSSAATAPVEVASHLMYSDVSDHLPILTKLRFS